MSLTLDENKAKYQIRAYQPGKIQINDDFFTHSLIISPQELIRWAPQTIHELAHEHLALIIPMRPAILLVGTGTELKFPPIALYGDLINAGIGVEFMTTQAACRTYNALTAEDRKVVAALIIPLDVHQEKSEPF